MEEDWATKVDSQVSQSKVLRAAFHIGDMHSCGPVVPETYAQN